MPARLTYTVAEAAQLLGISRAKGYECARTGELPVVRLGRRMLVPLPAVAELLGLPADYLARRGLGGSIGQRTPEAEA